MWHLLCHAGKALLRMLRPRIKCMELGLQAGHHELVHLDVRPAGGRIEACVTASQTVQVRAMIIDGKLAHGKVPHGASDALAAQKLAHGKQLYRSVSEGKPRQCSLTNLHFGSCAVPLHSVALAQQATCWKT